MKSILLASASIVAFAGAAAAEVSFGGDAKLGYNDTVEGDHDGFYWDANLAVTLSQALNNGLTAKATFGLEINDEDTAGAARRDVVSSDYLLELASENSSLQFGDVEFAAVSVWNTAGAWLISDDFSEQDGESVLRGNVNYNGVDARISYLVADADGAEYDDLEQLSLGAKAAFGNFNVALAYQDEALAANARDLHPEETVGLTLGTTFSGATVVLSYAQETGIDTIDGSEDGESIGLSVAYPVGPVSLRGWVADNSLADELSYGLRAIYTADAFSITANYEHRAGVPNALGETVDPVRWNLEGSYNVGNGLTAYAGILGRDAWEDEVFYVAGEMDLGNGAALLVSYADADAEGTSDGYLSDDEVGAREYQVGMTAEVSFTF